MNKRIKNQLAYIIIAVVTILTGCKKEQVPVVTTTEVSDITATSVVSGGNIIDEGSSAVISRGVCWSIDSILTINANKTTNGSGTGSFKSNIIDLFGGTTYFVRAYATNSSGIGYGMVLSFKTTGPPPSAPSVTSQNASGIQVTSATLNGTVNPMYYSTTVSFEYGTTINYGGLIAASQSPVTGSTNTNVSANLSGLTAGTTYHYRLKAVNLFGTTYSNDISFTTEGQAPIAISTQ